MRVLLFARRGLCSKPGGDTYQVEKTAILLRELGHMVRIAEDADPSELDSADLLHLFNIQRAWEHLPLAFAAHKKGMPVILSPIYYPLDSYHRCGRAFPWSIASALSVNHAERLRSMAHLAMNQASPASALRQIALGGERIQNILLGCCSALACCAKSEQSMLLRRYRHVSGIPVWFVPNILDERDSLHADMALPKQVPRGYVLMAGRVEDLKNQIGLIKALELEDIPLVFAGSFNNKHFMYKRYFERAISRRPQTWHFPQLPRPSYLALFQGAAVHALPSYCETIGQVNLEALHAGLPIVVTSRSYIGEYFPQYCHACDPENSESIRSAVKNALTAQAPGMAGKAAVIAACGSDGVRAALNRLYKACF